MKTLAEPVWSFAKKSDPTIKQYSVTELRQGPGGFVNDYQELVEQVAYLAFKNPEYVLLFRGQADDYRNRTNSTILYPSIFRAATNVLATSEMKRRFERLKLAEQFLAEEYDFEGKRRIRIHEILRWALLQHYEVCPTPLIDATSSLRVACSFAYWSLQPIQPMIYVLGLPQISGSVTASSETGIQIIRLLSICPPSALRPNYQDGYLIGEYPTITLEAKREYQRAELDFSRRLICKFRLPPAKNFWSKDFQPIPRAALYPNDRDMLYPIAANILKELEKHSSSTLPNQKARL
jgi:hypothetical protein